MVWNDNLIVGTNVPKIKKGNELLMYKRKNE